MSQYLSDAKNLIPWHVVRVRRFRFIALVTLAPAGLRAGTPHASSRQYANHTRNRLAWLLLGRVRAGLVRADAGHRGHATLTFRLYATGRVLAVDGGRLTLLTTGLTPVIMGGRMDTFLQNPLGNPLRT
jgi:hypothetical protein